MFSDTQAEYESTILQLVGMRTKRNKEKRTSPTPRSTVHLAKPTVAWIIKELHILYGT
jgi:hypothetical protein